MRRCTKAFHYTNVSPYVAYRITANIEQEMIRTSVKAFLSATLALCKRRITFLAPSTTAASIRKRCRSSSTLSSSASSKLGSYLSVIRMFHVIDHTPNIPPAEQSARTTTIPIHTWFEWSFVSVRIVIPARRTKKLETHGGESEFPIPNGWVRKTRLRWPDTDTESKIVFASRQTDSVLWVASICTYIHDVLFTSTQIERNNDNDGFFKSKG